MSVNGGPDEKCIHISSFLPLPDPRPCLRSHGDHKRVQGKNLHTADGERRSSFQHGNSVLDPVSELVGGNSTVSADHKPDHSTNIIGPATAISGGYKIACEAP